jgi:putative ABC transport system permease protein
MVRNYLAAALRNLYRNKFYAAINIAGLAIAFAAAILSGLFVRNELSFDHFLSDADHTYLMAAGMSRPDRPRTEYGVAPPDIAQWMKLDFPEIEQIARIDEDWSEVQRGAIHSNGTEHYVYADPNIFSVLRFPALAGNLQTALEAPDSVVITRAIARKYFGVDNPLGRTMEVSPTDVAGWHAVRVTAVLKDFPPETHWDADIFLSGNASFARWNQPNREPCSFCFGVGDVRTYLRLKPGASIRALQKAMPDRFARHQGWPRVPEGMEFFFSFVPVSQLHHRPDILLMEKPATDPTLIWAAAGFGVLIIVIASINFVNLMTARASRRAVEVGVRKAAGAGRADLIVQFIGESLLYVVLGMAVAMALVEQLLPLFNTFLGRSIRFDWNRDLSLAGALLLLVVGVGVLAGSYPALILSAFRPATVLKSGLFRALGSGKVRHALVAAQFAILIGAMIATAVIYRQTLYAMNAGTHLDKDQVLLMWACAPAFKTQVEELPGVAATTCSTMNALTDKDTAYSGVVRQGRISMLSLNTVDFGFFELYGIRPLAGRTFSAAVGADTFSMVALDPHRFQQRVGHAVINMAAVRALGFKSPSDAIGKSVVFIGEVPNPPTEIIGVVPDFSTEAVRLRVPPTAYAVPPAWVGNPLMSIKVKAGQAPQTIRSVEALWKAFGGRQSDPYFLDVTIQTAFADMQKLATLLAIVAGISLFVACLGLFGLAAFTAEQRTKEIGIRKAMGAERVNIVGLLVWSFTKPVLWANLAAWPVAFWLMTRWLEGFTDHVDLAPWLFLASGGLALAIAWITVGLHAFFVAGAKPAKALRYE